MIRPARDGDAAAIAAIWNPIIRNTVVTFTSVEKTEADIIAVLAARAFDRFHDLVLMQKLL